MKRKPIVVYDFTANKKQQDAYTACMSGAYDAICYGGAIRGGKTFCALAIAWALMVKYPGYKCVFVRETEKKLLDTTIPSFNKLSALFNCLGKIQKKHMTYTMPNGSVIQFFAENIQRNPDLDNFKGLELDSFFLEEISELNYETYKKCNERTGSLIRENDYSPKFIFCTCNPTFEWPKQEFYTPHKLGKLSDRKLYIQANANDNPYIPQKTKDQWKRTMLNYEYKTFIEGNWDYPIIKEGMYLSEYNPDKHNKHISFDTSLPAHVSIDDNVHPYLAVSIWQYKQADNLIKLCKVGEIPCAENMRTDVIEDPVLLKTLKQVGRKNKNNAEAAGHLTGTYLKNLGLKDIVILHGDATSKKRNTISEKNFYEHYLTGIRQHFETLDKVAKSNPKIDDSGKFVNTILGDKIEGVTIEVNEKCTNTINDWISSQKDANEKMIKKNVTENGITYQKNGHFLDTDRYFVIGVLRQMYKLYLKNKVR